MKSRVLAVIQSLFLSSVILILSLLLPIILLTSLVVFGFYRQIIRLILKIKYQNVFFGLLEEGDVIWAVEDISKSIINSVVVVEFDKNVQTFAKTITNIVNEECFQKESKVSCVRKKFLGYSFLLKNQYSVDECVQIVNVDGRIDTSFLEKYISECCETDMPKDNSALCQILIFDNTVEWSNKKNQFVILFRIHHSLGDGFSLITLLLRHLVDSRQKLETYVDLWTRSQPKKKWFAYLWTVLFGPAVVVLHHLFRPVDKNYLHRRKLCGEKIIAWAAEKEEKLVPLVKMIKNKSPGTRFSDVVLAAVSASLAEFLHTKNHSDTNFVTCIIPTLLNFKCTTSLENPKNNFSVAELRLPLHSDNILDTLQDVRTATQALRHSPDYLVHFWLLRTLAPVLPEPFLNLLIYSRHSTMAISILPGTGKLTMLKGHSLDDMIFWIPHRGSTGVGLSVLSYDNRFQIGLTVDKALLLEQKDAQAIVDGVFKYILKLHQNISAIV